MDKVVQHSMSKLRKEAANLYYVLKIEDYLRILYDLRKGNI